MLTNQEIKAKYGKPGDIHNLTTIDLPFSFFLDWDVTSSVKKIICHKLIAESLKAALQEILDHYGPEKIKELGIDQFAGCFNFRAKRGFETQYAAAIERKDNEEALKYLSTHSWAIAIDLDANRNTLKETSKTARFARKDYQEMIDIFYRHGFISYGREKNYDWMHFEIGS